MTASLSAAVHGSISGEVKDPAGLVVRGASVGVINTATGIQMKTVTGDSGLYTFPSLPVGAYTLEFSAAGFRSLRRTGVTVDADSALKEDVKLELAVKSETATVVDSAIQIETASTQLGQVVKGSTMAAVALNGRSYTDLLALQAGIVPASTQTPDSIVMAGATVAVSPSGGLNPGNQSIGGQREDANGFIVNEGDVKELMNGGTLVVPNLDSIAEFRVLTNNFDARYGNYTGGIVNVVTKSGANELHGNVFEFLRNTVLDARNFYSPERSFYRHNQYGATIGGPIRRNKLFYFGDYQSTHINQGIDTGLIDVPSLANRAGDLGSRRGELTGAVSGPYLAGLLSGKLGYAVSAGEPYYTSGCVTSSQCVLPNAVVPRKVWSAPAQNLLQHIPAPNLGASTFSTSSEGQTTRDDKGSFRVDANSNRWGMFTAYYFFDDYRVNNPYPTGQGGASVPGFNALNLGRAQLANFGNTRTFGAASVNEFHMSFMRSANNVGQPSGGVGPSLASQGFVTGPGTPGIVPLAPSIEGVENVIFNSFVMGAPITNLIQANNSFAVNDNFAKVWGGHSVRVGFEASYQQVNVNPNPTFNGSFLFSGSETGSDFADFLIGVASNYNQADSQAFYLRHKYAAGFAQDSWRVRPNLTVNYGLRWDLMQYWSEKYNQIPTLIPGEQSAVFTNAPVGLVYPGDKGVPSTLVPQRNRFSPRLGIAWSPGGGKTSIRAGFGIYYNLIQGNVMAFDEPQPPYGLSYTSPGPPLFATPFISAADGSFAGNPFPLRFPSLNTSPSNPNSSIDFAQFEPIAGMTAPPPTNTYPYTENYFVSIERQLGTRTLASVSYVGSQSHHLLMVYSANPGNPALCLELSQPGAVAEGSATCGPFQEDLAYTRKNGQIVEGTRSGLGPAFSNDDYNASVGNAAYNSVQANLRHSSGPLSVTLAYTYSKSIDQASSFSDPGNPFNLRATRSLSAFDLRQNFVATGEYRTRSRYRMASAWMVSGIFRATTGFPVTLKSTGDNSLMGSIPNGVNNYSLDLPDYNGQPLRLNHDPRNGAGYFSVSAFEPNALGTAGNASRRAFSGPGSVNLDLALARVFRLAEQKTLQFRAEAFNAFNHAQFFGAGAVNGNIDSAHFGQVVKAAAPRLMQVALKFTF